MGCLGNLIWFICGGAISGLSWFGWMFMVYYDYRNSGGNAVL